MDGERERERERKERERNRQGEGERRGAHPAQARLQRLFIIYIHTCTQKDGQRDSER